MIKLDEIGIDDDTPDQRARPGTIATMILDIELARTSDARLAELRAQAKAQVGRYSKLAGQALDTGAAVRRLVLSHEARAYGEQMRQIDDEIAKRAEAAAAEPSNHPLLARSPAGL